MRYYIDEDTLQHWGVKGMRWGVRKDRSANSNKPQHPKDQWGRSKLHTPNTKAHRMFDTPARMSDAQLRDRIKRLEMETKYRDLVAKDRAQGQKVLRIGAQFASDILKNVASSYLSDKVKNHSWTPSPGNYTVEQVRKQIGR